MTRLFKRLKNYYYCYYFVFSKNKYNIIFFEYLSLLLLFLVYIARHKSLSTLSRYNTRKLRVYKRENKGESVRASYIPGDESCAQRYPDYIESGPLVVVARV